MEEQAFIALLLNPATQNTAFQKLISDYQRPLYHHIRNIVLDHDDADDVHSTESFDPFVDESFHDLEETIHKCIDSMPAQRKLIFVLSRFEDYTNKKIADHLGLSIKTVENQMTKALKTLRHTIEYYKR